MLQRADGPAILANFKMQDRFSITPNPHRRYLVTGDHLVTFFYQNFLVVCIGTQKGVIVFDDNKLSIT